MCQFILILVMLSLIKFLLLINMINKVRKRKSSNKFEQTHHVKSKEKDTYIVHAHFLFLFFHKIWTFTEITSLDYFWVKSMQWVSTSELKLGDFHVLWNINEIRELFSISFCVFWLYSILSVTEELIYIA